MAKQLDIEGKALIPGHLYCTVRAGFDGRNEYGVLVWFCTDGNLYHAEGTTDGEFDEFDPEDTDYGLLAQAMQRPNPKYVLKEHDWRGDGDHCVKCGASDWMAGGCQ